MKAINMIAFILIIVGALNWGLWGFFQFDLVAYIFGGNTTGLARLIYSLVGLSGLWGLRFFSNCDAICSCKSKGK